MLNSDTKTATTTSNDPKLPAAERVEGRAILTVDGKNTPALWYVGTYPIEGLEQFKLLQTCGLKPTHRVLEIGCGALVAGIPIIDFLDGGNYVGIEPNGWLIDQTRALPQNESLCQMKKPTFLLNDQFDAAAAVGNDPNKRFDFVLSHSVISHAAKCQFIQFLERTANVLKPGGKLLFSCRLVEPNGHQGTGSGGESTFTTWQYPGNTFFHRATVIVLAKQHFKTVEERPDFTNRLVATHCSAAHDWFLCERAQ